MQQPQDNEFTRAEEIRKLRVIPELISHHLEIRGDDPAVCQFNAKTKQWETLSFKELYARVCSLRFKERRSSRHASAKRH